MRRSPAMRRQPLALVGREEEGGKVARFKGRTHRFRSAIALYGLRRLLRTLILPSSIRLRI